MERCGIKDVEASGEDGPMARCPTKSLKAAAAAGDAASEPQGLFAGLPTLGWAAKKTGPSDVKKAFAMAMVALAIAQQAMVTANKAAALAALASKEDEAAAAAAAEASREEEEAASKELQKQAAAKQAEGKEFQKEAAAAVDDDTDSEDGEGEAMTSLEYIKTYKVLPPHEVELILKKPLERTPFTDSYVYKALCADPDATQEGVTSAYEEREEQQDMKIEFRERVRSEYEANGYVTVNDEYIAMRVRNEELSNRLWEEAFADYDDEVAGFDSEVDVEVEVAHLLAAKCIEDTISTI